MRPRAAVHPKRRPRRELQRRCHPTHLRQDNEWKDGETSWVRCVAWRKLAENIAASLQKRHRVIVAGRFAERRYEDKEGNKRSAWELTVDACGPDLTFVEATVRKVDRVHQSPPEGDPWTTEARPAQAEEVPF